MLHAYRKSGGVAVPVSFSTSGVGSPGNFPEPASRAEFVAGMGVGVNLGNWFDAPTVGQYGGAATQIEMIDLRAAGAGHVRLCVRWSAHATENTAGTINAGFMDQIASLVDWLLTKFPRVILNLHHYKALHQQAIEAPETSWSGTYSDHATRFKNMWAQIATRFAGYSKRLGFEPDNEPTGGWLTASAWNTLSQETTAIIRASGGNNAARVVVIGPIGQNDPSQIHTLVLPADTSNVMATVHDYQPFQYTHAGAFGSATGLNAFAGGDWLRYGYSDAWQVAKDWAVAQGVPLWGGEAGSFYGNSNGYAEATARLRYYTALREQHAASGDPLCFWNFKSDFGMFDQNTITGWVPGMREVISGAFEPLPALATPAGYTATVLGGTPSGWRVLACRAVADHGAL